MLSINNNNNNKIKNNGKDKSTAIDKNEIGWKNFSRGRIIKHITQEINYYYEKKNHSFLHQYRMNSNHYRNHYYSSYR